MEKFINEKVIVRAKDAGVFFGTLAEKDGNEVLLKDVRRIYYWDGASECIELAQAGCSQESKSPTIRSGFSPIRPAYR